MADRLHAFKVIVEELCTLSPGCQKEVLNGVIAFMNIKLWERGEEPEQS